MRSSGFTRSGGLPQKRSYVVPTKPVNIQITPPNAADATSVESLHMRAGVFDTSKGMYFRNWEDEVEYELTNLSLIYRNVSSWSSRVASS
jgi:hypothetical protein